MRRGVALSAAGGLSQFQQPDPAPDAHRAGRHTADGRRLPPPGCLDPPRVAHGRVAVRLHLLAPNGRPAQVTTDLRSFWEHTYPEVRKGLRGRYPKHDWPEDPLTARPTSGVRARRRKA